MSDLMDRCLRILSALQDESLSKHQQIAQASESFQEMVVAILPGDTGKELAGLLSSLDMARKRHGVTREDSIAKLTEDEQSTQRESLRSTAELGLQAASKLLIDQFDLARGRLPVEAMLEIRQYREFMVPALITRLERAIRESKHAITLGGAPLITLFLLAEFKAEDAFPTILKALALPDEQPFELFGDAITENMSSILAQTIGDGFELLDNFILRSEVNLYARQQALNVYLQCVRSQRISRDEALKRLCKFLNVALERRDAELATGVVSSLRYLAPREAMREIDMAYSFDLVDEGCVAYRHVEAATKWDKAKVFDALDHAMPAGIVDSVAELKKWACFQNSARQNETLGSAFVPAPHSSPSQARQAYAYSSGTASSRPGRNDQCPCGSGKKYKKCCGQ